MYRKGKGEVIDTYHVSLDPAEEQMMSDKSIEKIVQKFNKQLKEVKDKHRDEMKNKEQSYEAEIKRLEDMLSDYKNEFHLTATTGCVFKYFLIFCCSMDKDTELSHLRRETAIMSMEKNKWFTQEEYVMDTITFVGNTRKN